MAKKKTGSNASAANATIIAYKGFNADLTCRDYQYAVGETYRHDGKVVACPNESQVARGEGGFHACEYPLDVFRYYGPAASRFAIVELGGDTARHDEDSKIAAAEITIKAEIRLPEMIAAAVKYVTDRVKWVDGDRASGEKEGARCADHGGAATASGDRGAATASGRWGAATASGYKGKARGKAGCALFLVERASNSEIIHAWAGIAGRDGIEADTFYTLKDGKPVKAED